MTRTVQITRLSRLAITAAALGGVVSLASCGDASMEGEQTETRTSAQTVAKLSDLMTALTQNPYDSIVLTADLDAKGFNWQVGYFAGTLDGGTHTITNLTTSDSIGQGAGMFQFAEFATIKNLKLINLRVSGKAGVGGLVGNCSDCTIDSVSVEGAVNSPDYVGGIVGNMAGGSLTKSYFKGTVTGGARGAGGLVGIAAGDSIDYAHVRNCYAQAASQTATLVAGSTARGTHPAGGIVGAGTGMWVEDVYAIGSVTGRGSAGGLIGQPTCGGVRYWVLNRGIYRGNVTDANLADPGGWAGTIGKAADLTCDSRSTGLFFNSDLDTNTNFLPITQRRSTGRELTAPTGPTPADGGIFCGPTTTDAPCGDDPFTTPPWAYGTSSQNNTLPTIPGPNAQIK